MTAVLDALARSLAYCFMPRVVALSLLPLLMLMACSGLLAWAFWEQAVAWVREALEMSALLAAALKWLEAIGAPSFKAVLAPLILVAAVVPVLVVACLMVVAQFMTPSLVKLVAQRRFAHLERRKGSPVWWSVVRSLGLSALAVLVLLVSTPLWLVPPLVLLVPPLVWGWLAMQVMSFDVLADHATPQERAALMKQHRWPLLGIGVASGLLGAAPGAVWVFSALTLVLAPLVMVASIWLYTAVFALTSLWFAHYLLAALQRHRMATEGEVLDPLPTGAAVLDPAALAAPPSSAPPAASQP
ncbi:MAG: hypothetical protein RL584_1917 [Pseudomonadota bacterium]|jgi:hypothetical protein